MVRYLIDTGQNPIVFDNLSNGHRDAVSGAEFVLGDLADHELIVKTLKRFSIQAVMHFASFIEVGESVVDPAKYYRNNVSNTQNLLDAMVDTGVKYLVFSSTAAIFGNPDYTPIDEAHAKAPINPYGRSKWMVEQMLDDYDAAYGLRSSRLRYFNAAGAHPSGELGERHEPETHLIPLILQAATGQRDFIKVFGRDYATPDGTCLRDYIHICDLASAHDLALKQLIKTDKTCVYNLGNGAGFSVQQVIDLVKSVSGVDFRVDDDLRRAGDPAVLVADSTLARQELGWAPKYGDLRTIIEHAWAFEKARWDAH
jgi:UDP-glucose 4-epimerase